METGNKFEALEKAIKELEEARVQVTNFDDGYGALRDAVAAVEIEFAKLKKGMGK